MYIMVTQPKNDNGQLICALVVNLTHSVNPKSNKLFTLQVFYYKQEVLNTSSSSSKSN